MPEIKEHSILFSAPMAPGMDDLMNPLSPFSAASQIDSYQPSYEPTKSTSCDTGSSSDTYDGGGSYSSSDSCSSSSSSDSGSSFSSD